MFRKVKITGMISFGILASAMLVGCSDNEIMYDGKLQNETVVEEIIADKLEVDNPEQDLEVNIYVETED